MSSKRHPEKFKIEAVKQDDLIIQPRELPVIAVLAFSGSVTDTINPLVIASNRIATSTLLVLPTSRENICSASKKVPENINFLVG